MSIWQEVARMIEDYMKVFTIRADQIATQIPGGSVAPASGSDRGTVALSDSNPDSLGTADPGTGTAVSRDDHVHPHGDLGGGTLHDEATSTLAGFVPAASGTDGDVLTIDTGVWVAAPPAVGMTNPMTTLGDIITGDTGGTPIRLGIGTSDQVLTVVAGVPAWADPTGGTGGAYATDIGDGIATTFVITHGLGTRDVLIGVRQNGSPYEYVIPDEAATSTSTITLTFGVAPSTDEYRVIILMGGSGGGGGGFSNPMTTLGDLIIGGSSGTPARLGVGTDGDVLTLVSGSPDWVTPSGGSGFVPPPSASWSWDNQGSASATIVGSALVLDGPVEANTSPHNHVYYRSAPGSTPWTLTAAFRLTATPSDYSNGGVGLRESSSGKIILWRMLYNTGVWQMTCMYGTAPTTESGNLFSFSPGPTPYGEVWIRITDNGTNRLYYLSTDGIAWVLVYTEGRTTFLTADQLIASIDARNTTYGAALTVASWEVT